MHPALLIVPLLCCVLGAVMFGTTTAQDWPHTRTQDRAIGAAITLALATAAGICAAPVALWIGGYA